MPAHENLLGGPPPTYLPDNPQADKILAESGPEEAAKRYPTYSHAWGVLAEQALDEGNVLAGYAFARTGYHRGLDALRRNGWKGHGPIPWEHAPNRGFLRCLAALARAAGEIGETEEADRCWTFLDDSSHEAYAALRIDSGSMGT
jgi:hypothetical protein